MESQRAPGWDQDRRRLLALALVPGMGPITFHRLLAAFGSVDRIFGATRAELSQACPRLGAQVLLALRKGPDFFAVEAQDEICARLGARLLTYRCPGYPARLLSIACPPPMVFMRGEWKPEDAKALSVVGTRYPTSYGVRAARDLCLPLAEAGWTLVSGLARGIDTLAHDSALAGGARTVAVMGTGLDCVYPAENKDLARRIAERGCVITEFPMGMPALQGNFPRRNRIISALGLGTLVVEAGTDSGALITAKFAVEQGREVFAVPGTIQSPGSRGTHYLLREGAHLAASAQDVLDVLQGLNQAVPARRFDPDLALEAEAEAEPADADEPEAEHDAVSRRPGKPVVADLQAGRLAEPATLGFAPASGPAHLLALLSRKAMPVDALLEKARQQAGCEHWGPQSLLPGLLQLEMRGRVKRLPGALFRLA